MWVNVLCVGEGVVCGLRFCVWVKVLCVGESVVCG